MKRILTAVAALLLSAATFAQTNDSPAPVATHQQKAKTPMTPEQKAKREADRINNLTPLGDAYQKVVDVYAKYNSDREAITKGSKGNDLSDDQKSQLKKLRETLNPSLKAAMGNDLYEKWRAAEKAKREERKSQQGGGAQPAEGGK